MYTVITLQDVLFCVLTLFSLVPKMGNVEIVDVYTFIF